MARKSWGLDLFRTKHAALPFDYRVRVNRRHRRARISVNLSGEVLVQLPGPLPEPAIQQLLQAHRDWIGARLAELDRQRAELPAQLGLAPDRVRLGAIDRDWSVEYGAALGRRLWREAAGRLQLRADGDEPAARRSLQHWLQHQARTILPPWLARIGESLGLQHSGVTIRAQKTRWGSCSSRGNINLNRNLLFLPAELVEYLLIHELCHLRHANHSRDYWQLVAQCLPDYRARDRALRTAVNAIPLWARAGE